LKKKKEYQKPEQPVLFALPTATVVGSLTSPPGPLSILERGNRGQGVKGVRLKTALVVGSIKKA